MRALIAILVVLPGLAVLGPAPLEAQATRADSAAVILETAERFRSDGRDDVARALVEYILEHFGDTASAAEASRMLSTVLEDEGAGGGRVELQVWSTTYGLWLGVAIPAAFGADGAEPYGVGLLLGGPAGFFAGARIARSRALSVGQARAITLGGTWGTWQGLGWASVLDWGEPDFSNCAPQGPCNEVDKSTERRFAAMVLGGLTGLATGAVISRNNIPSGVATAVNFGALWGTWFGLAGGIILGIKDDKLLATTLVAGNGGLISTALLATRWKMSRNRARLISIAGVIGGLGGAGLDLILQPDDEETAVAIPLVTSIAGLAIGAATTRNYDAPAVSERAEAEADALFLLRDGRLSVGSAAVTPVLVPVRRNGRRSYELEAGITLFNARF